MSVTIDANVLVYASDAGSPRQARALEVLREQVEGPGLVYLFWPVGLAYLRIATHPSIFDQPLTPAEASGNLQALLERPSVRAPARTTGSGRPCRRPSPPPRRGAISFPTPISRR